MANPTSGKRRGVSGRPGTRPWYEDAELLRRAVEGWDLWASGKTLVEVAAEQRVSIDTVNEDRRRLIDAYKMQGIDRVDEHIQNLRNLQRKCYELLGQTDNRSLNKTALLARIESVEIHIAKLDGSFKERVDVDAKTPITFTLNLSRDEER